LREQKYKESIELFRRRQAILQRLGTPMDPDVGIAMEDIASAYLAAHEYLDAEDNLKRAITFFEQCVNKLRVRGVRSSLSPCDGHLTLSRGYLGIVYFQQSRFGDAEPLLKMTTSLPDNATLPLIMMAALRSYATILQRSNRDKESAPLLERLEKLRAAHPDVVAQAEATLREQRAH
jgi:hypothetical protein